MPKICSQDKRFSAASQELIDQANDIIAEYARDGYDLTLRQLYYQFVSRDLIPNTIRSYKRLGSIINDGRLAGLIDWNAIEDRTRNLSKLAHWDDPGQLVAACGRQFMVDKWASQPYRPEVWIEKEALSGVFQRVCEELDVPFFACRGYVSQSEMWRAARRLLRYSRNGQTPIIFHFGDHDPSGIDMTRDIRDRVALFGAEIELNRMALNMDQVDQYGPPPNPAKTTDARFQGYVVEYGDESWELDALDPKSLARLVRSGVESIRDAKAWGQALDREITGRQRLSEVAEELTREE